MENHSPEALQQENQHLREQIAALTARLEQHERIATPAASADNIPRSPQSAFQADELELFRTILESSPDNILIWDEHYNYLYANQAAIDQVGTTRAMVIGKNIRDGLGHIPDFMRLWMSRIDHVIATGETVQREESLQIGDTTATSISTMFPIRDKAGRVYAMGLIYRDITKQKQQEDILRENEQRLQFALEGSGDGTWDWNMSTNEAQLSDHYRELLGYRPDELPDSVDSWISNIHPDDLPSVQQHLNDYLEGRIDTYAIEHRIQHKSGEWRWMLSRGKVILRDAEGNPTRMTGTVSDVTERKRQEEEVHIFKTMADTAPDGFGMADANGTLTYANAAYRALTGYGDALVGMNFLDHFTEEDRLMALEALSTTARQGDWHGVLNFERQDGSIIPVDTKGFVTRDEAGNIVAVMGLFRDLTEQYRMEAERTALQQQIIDAQRDALRELSTPLIPITDKVVIMPLIGTIDSQRAQLVMETLLEGVARHRASLAILDITGVSMVDTQVAQAFIQAAQAVKLLGAQVMLTGIQPQIAQTLVHLGIDLSGIQTQSSLQAGIAAAL